MLRAMPRRNKKSPSEDAVVFSRRSIHMAMSAPVIAAPPTPIVAPAVAPKRKRKAIMPSAAPSAPAPAVTVVELLQNKDTLVTAFLLREILAPPISKR